VFFHPSLEIKLLALSEKKSSFVFLCKYIQEHLTQLNNNLSTKKSTFFIFRDGD